MKRLGYIVFMPLALVLLTIVLLLQPKPRIRLITQVYPPYQQSITDGSSVEIVRCAMDATNSPYSIDIVPGTEWALAQERTRLGEFDGFFGALRTPERDIWATRSDAISSHKSYIIGLKGAEDFRAPGARFGVKNGSGNKSKLEAQGFTITVTTDDNPELVRALLDHKIDYVYMDFEVFKWAASSINVTNLSLFSYSPMGEQLYSVYWSKSFLHNRTDFLARFNLAVAVCRQRGELS